TQTRLDDLTRFEDFYRIPVEAHSKWNSFSLERIHGACARLREQTLRESASPQEVVESSPPTYRAKREISLARGLSEGQERGGFGFQGDRGEA
ncbi:unnamed protein product, partial [Cochlearia groenlandica]